MLCGCGSGDGLLREAPECAAISAAHVEAIDQRAPLALVIQDACVGEERVLSCKEVDSLGLARVQS